MLRLHTTQRHLYQGVGAFDFVHGCQGQDLTRRLGVKLDAVLGHGQGTDQVFGDLDEDLFEGGEGFGW